MNIKTGTINISLAVLLLLFVFAAPAFSGDSWEARITVAAGDAENKLSFGQRADATSGVDGQYDVPALLAGGVKAWFGNVEGPLWRDIQAGGASWTLSVEAANNGAKVTLSWDTAKVPSGVKLKDLRSDTVVDMHTTGEFVYTNDGKRRDIAITAN
ncbi:MAG: hypothetical protein OEV59_01720 [Deltaproteobacteria bacterium]|nr:hypothetical protein [Deltaproteobacteria bacterium]